ncbi:MULTISPECIES: hypothetical protein [Streptosporangium]|uniref:Uncharacterized protein n=1 Tax=Streptosporangium brasiliense TaxID=47480 RepID=A0ABT9R6K9_9ACTN|nr:hypothetical protein [Streptosporangium brasiliense]MDP9864884.1 hypothetical protein [Streptosporangium brasiliense]
MLDDLPQLGFACVDVGVGHVRYRMPHFEASSLKVTAPHLPVPTDWRAGDVLVLEKVADSNMSRPSDLDMELWRDCRFGPVRIKTRHTKGTDLGSLVAGDVLDTVSRRDPIRQQIGLWTSGNRVFSLTHDRAISKLIDLCHSDLMRSQFSEASTRNHARKLRLTSRIASRLFHLLLVEFQEHTIQKDLQVP